MGFRTVPIEIGSRYTDESWSQQLMTVNEFVDRFMRKERSEIGYLAQHRLFTQIPHLLSAVIVPDYCLLLCEREEDVDLNIWFGPAQTVSPLHTDPRHNLFCQVVGRKFIRLIPPCDSDKVYANEDGILTNTSRVVDAEHWDERAFPLFAQAQHFDCIVNAGEALFIPKGWWHYPKLDERLFAVCWRDGRVERPAAGGAQRSRFPRSRFSARLFFDFSPDGGHVTPTTIGLSAQSSLSGASSSAASLLIAAMPDTTASVLRPPDAFTPATDLRVVRWAGASLLLVGLVWLVDCLALYFITTGYHSSELYEARWMPAALPVTGALCILFSITLSKVVFAAMGIAAQYSIGSCLITLLVNVVDLVQAVGRLEHAARPGHRTGQVMFIQVCLCMCIISVIGLAVSGALLWRLQLMATWHFESQTLPSKQRQTLQILSGMQTGLAVFSIYVTSQILTLKTTYIQSYMVQEIFCAILLLVLTVMQTGILGVCNKLLLRVVVIANVAQFIQELSHAWTAYYVSLYLHSTGVKIAGGLHYDQVIMTLNFLVHCSRMVMCGYTAWSLSVCLGLKVLKTRMALDYDRRVIVFAAGIAACSLLLGTCHVVLDMIYATMEHVYRTLLASTGIAVFYSNLIGITFSLFIRSRCLVWLAIVAVFSLLMSVSSVHALYIYLQTTFTRKLLENLKNLGFEGTVPSILHFFEAILALAGLIIGILAGAYCLRLLKMESAYRKKGGNMFWPMRLLRIFGMINLFLTVTELLFIFQVKLNWKFTDAAVNYGVLDSISMLATCFLQLWVTHPNNLHFQWPLLVLVLQLFAEALTTIGFLSAQTNYVQMMLTFYRVQQQSGYGGQKVRDVFPIDQIGFVMAGHFIQAIQWALVTASLIAAAVAQERIDEAEVLPIPSVEAGCLNQAFDSRVVDEHISTISYTPTQSSVTIDPSATVK
uniref:JmjC domain-containing protein n=1 Tax=Plectus sambesii TaxID=2011161 RepID=A0A914VLL8_9BILA